MEEKAIRKDRRIKEKLCYGAGDIYGGGAFLVFSLLYMNFLMIVEGLDPIYATIAIFIGKVWDAITDPLIGRLSDKTRTKFGRRRFYFLIGVIPVAVSFVTLFYCFGITSTVGLVIYNTLAYMFFGTAFTIVMVPYNAILSDITSDYNERTSFTTIRMIISGTASLICAVVPTLIINGIGGDVNGANQKTGYLVMAIALGVVFGLCWLIVFFGTKERKDVPKVEKISIKDWLSLFKSRPYMNFLGIFLFFQIAVDLVLAVFVFYVDLVLNQYQNYTLYVGLLLVFQVIFMVLNNFIAQKKGKVFPLFIGLPLWIIVSFIFIFIDSSTPMWIICIMSILIAVGSSAGNLCTWSMLSDVYDIDELITGKRREGLYSGVTTFVRKFSSGIAVLLLGIGLSALGFDQNAYNVAKETMENFDPEVWANNTIIQGIKWIFVLLPIILCLVCLVFAVFNKMNKKRFDSVQTGIKSFKENGNLDNLNSDVINDIEIVTHKKKTELWSSPK